MILILSIITTLFGYEIKQADLRSDLDQIAATINLAYRKQPFNRIDYPRVTLEKLKELLVDQENQLFCLATTEGQICGTILLHGPELSLFSIHPDYQRQRLGPQLLQYAEEEAFKTHDAVYLKVIPLFQEHLIQYYESLGYESFGECEPLSQEKLERIQEQYREQVSALIMRKQKPMKSLRIQG